MVQVLINPIFTIWPHGTPVTGAWGGGRETALGWKSKWNKSPASRGTASKLAASGGLLYRLMPAPGIRETFYLRQTVPHLLARLGRSYVARMTARPLNAGVRAGWYVNARWNVDQRIPGLNTGEAGLPFEPGPFRVLEAAFNVPSGEGIDWRLDSSQGIEFAILLTTAVPSIVQIRRVVIYEA